MLSGQHSQFVRCFTSTQCLWFQRYICIMVHKSHDSAISAKTYNRKVFSSQHQTCSSGDAQHLEAGRSAQICSFYWQQGFNCCKLRLVHPICKKKLQLMHEIQSEFQPELPASTHHMELDQMASQNFYASWSTLNFFLALKIMGRFTLIKQHS